MLEDFKIKAGEFEGPLELLLDLIEKRKFHINSISLAQVADDFIEYIKIQEEFPMADSADFLLIASTLLLIKSKSLLPNLDLTIEEEGSIENLEERLRQYQKYKELAQGIQERFGHFLFFAEESRQRPVVFAATAEINVTALQRALQEVLASLPKPVVLPKVTVEKVISLEEMMESLSQKIQQSFKMSFRDFAKNGNDKSEKLNVIVSFLAMLELVKRGAVRVSQASHFADIEMESENVNIPTYQ